MTLAETVIEAVREYYEIPAGAEISINEEVDYGGCCHSVGGTETYINYSYVPEGKKRRHRSFKSYSGTIWELINDMP